ncbi:hypothetical protein TRFO_11738 [Tritrichomonas foetus]|uniref:Spt6 SH2 domain-containing protein n=1 Tax=Tritrichomonas foetus TaxID=1144522 RepID=A0A1J4J466_9EUKA|nr:hypothetical protein TRFO_11738 [Tritrichomonas foetus]|eukprot:OHS93529.1 hypothetical protein TRFO_11738 [Tritrichomonas foetus]
MHPSGGGKGISGKTPQHIRNNISFSRSDSSDSEDLKDLLQDGILKDKRQNSLKKISDSDDIEQSSSDELEDDNLKNPISSKSQQNRTFHRTNEFVVDEDGRALEQTVHEIATADLSRLDKEHLDNAYQMFKVTSTKFQNIVEKKRSDAVDDSMKVKTTDLRISDDFEREFYSCEFDRKYIDYTVAWIFEKHFKNRIDIDDDKKGNSDDDSDADRNEEEDKDDDNPTIRAHKAIIENILLAMFPDPEEKKLKTTPQYIIKFKSDLYKKELEDGRQSIFYDDDIYTILAACKRCMWTIKKFEALARPITLWYTKKISDDELLAFVQEQISQFDAHNINDKIRFINAKGIKMEEDEDEVIDNPTPQHKLFGALVDEFLLSPELLANKLINGGTNEPPEPVKDPEVRLSAFLGLDNDNDEEMNIDFDNEFDKLRKEYIDRIKKEVECTQEIQNIEDEEEKSRAMKEEMINKLKEHIIRYAASELANNPIILGFLREQIAEQIVINTTPTERGEESPTMLPYGKYGFVKRLKQKMISSFYNTDTWLFIDEAQQKGFLNASIDYPNGIQGFLEQLKKQYYLSQYGSQWDDMRSAIIEMAFTKDIWPLIVKETNEELLSKSAESVKNDVEAKLFTKLTQPPYTKKQYPRSGVKVLSLCYHPDYPKEVGVAFVQPDGNVEHQYTVNSYILRNSNNVRTAIQADLKEENNNTKKGQQPQLKHNLTVSERAEYDGKKAILQTMKLYNPDVITICATCVRSRDLYTTAEAIMGLSGIKTTNIIFAPSDAALIYARSPCADAERRDLSQQVEISDVVLIAASTARRVQNPLSELTRLCTQQHNYLVNLPLHRFQSKFIEDGKEGGPIYEACELACIKAVAVGGIDVTKLNSKHHRGPLQFIPGFGPNYANFVLNEFISKGPINAREKFIYDCLDNQANLSMNAIAFLRFPAKFEKKYKNDDSDDSDDERHYDTASKDGRKLLNGTLIHPDHYRIAADLVRYFSRTENNGHTYAPDASIDENKLLTFFSNHITIDENEIDSFVSSDYLSLENRTTGISLLKFIANELSIGPFESYRFIIPGERPIRELSNAEPYFTVHPSLKSFKKVSDSIIRKASTSFNYYTPMTSHELFDTLVNDPSIKESSISEFRILRTLPDNIYLARSLTADIDGIATGQDTAFIDFNQTEIKQRVFRGAILGIDKSIMKLIVSFNPADIDSMKQFDNNRYLDTNFDVEGEREAQRRKREEEKNKPHRYSARFIDDSHFQNLTPDQAEAEIMSKEMGEYLFRPSTKGNDRLTLMIKFPGPNYGIYEIVERGKKGEHDLTLGSQLSIEANIFEDLEDIQWNFISPIKEKLDKAVQHRKWEIDREKAENAIIFERKTNPRLIPYRLTIDPTFRSCIVFLWLGKNQLFVEPMRLTPFEFRFRHCSYDSIDKAINHWKELGCKPPTEEERKAYSLQRLLTDAEEEKRKEREERETQAVNTYGIIKRYP